MKLNTCAVCGDTATNADARYLDWGVINGETYCGSPDCGKALQQAQRDEARMTETGGDE